MNKQEFFTRLRKGLSGLPREEVEERLAFYSEMIDDRMEEGLSEPEAVAAVGAADWIAAQITTDASSVKKEKRPWKAWEIILLVLGSPLWISLLAAALVVVLALYISLWAVIVSLWAVFGALVGCAAGCIAGGIVFVCCGKTVTGIAVVGAGLVCAGLSIYFFFGCKAATVGTALLTKLVFKKYFRKKEVTQ